MGGKAGCLEGTGGGGVGLECKIGGTCVGAGCLLEGTGVTGVNGKDGTAGVTGNNEGVTGAKVVVNLRGGVGLTAGNLVGTGGENLVGVGAAGAGVNNCGRALRGVFTDSMMSSPACWKRLGLGLKGGRGVKG